MGAFDGAGPDQPSQPSWKGVLTMVVVIVVVVALLAFAFAYAVAGRGAP